MYKKHQCFIGPIYMWLSLDGWISKCRAPGKSAIQPRRQSNQGTPGWCTVQPELVERFTITVG